MSMFDCRCTLILLGTIQQHSGTLLPGSCHGLLHCLLPTRSTDEIMGQRHDEISAPKVVLKLHQPHHNWRLLQWCSPPTCKRNTKNICPACHAPPAFWNFVYSYEAIPEVPPLYSESSEASGNPINAPPKFLHSSRLHGKSCKLQKIGHPSGVQLSIWKVKLKLVCLVLNQSSPCLRSVLIPPTKIRRFADVKGPRAFPFLALALTWLAMSVVKDAWETQVFPSMSFQNRLVYWKVFESYS